MVLEQAHAYISIEYLSKLVFKYLCSFLYEFKFLLFGHVLLIWNSTLCSSSTTLSRNSNVTLATVKLGLFFLIFGSWLLKVKCLVK